MHIKDLKKKIKVRKESAIFTNDFSPNYNEGYVISIQAPSRRVVKIETSGELADCWGYDDWEDPAIDYSSNFFLSFPNAVFGIHYKNVGGRVAKRSSS